KELNLFSLPFLMPDYRAMDALTQGQVGQQLFKVIEKNGVVPLAWGENGFREVSNSKREIRTPADMKGMKLRVPQAPLFLMFTKSVGANATPIAFAEVYLALQNGTVEAQENPLPTIEAKKFYEVQKNISLTGHIVDSLLTIVSGQLWGKLSDADKKIFTDVMQEAAEKAGREIIASEARLTDEFKKKGKNVIVVDKNAFREAVLKNTKPADHGYRQADYDRIVNIK
ncbi:DctP family TRAP transporter solute-binding subunit, partial [Ramlibacter sp.]|uniref:DctP family TRAP transporter solute-binding subunit n=1 Tax=Ramlibacter sp. TaxID=1917967 RepID=UPI002CD0FB6C